MPFDAFNQGAAVASTKSTVWTLEMALELVQAMNPFLIGMNYQAMLSGDVLNTGKGARLTLVVMPRSKPPLNKDLELITWLAETLGKAVNIQKQEWFKHGLQFKVDGLLVDVFINNGGV